MSYEEGMYEPEMVKVRTEMIRLAARIDAPLRDLLQRYCQAQHWRLTVEKGSYMGLRGAYWRLHDHTRSLWITLCWGVFGPYLDFSYYGRRARQDRAALGQAIHEATKLPVICEWDEVDSYQDSMGESHRIFHPRRLIWPADLEQQLGLSDEFFGHGEDYDARR